MTSVADYYLQKIRESYSKPVKHKPKPPRKQYDKIVDLPDEQWLPVEGYPHYQISNMGRLQSKAQSQPKLVKLSCIRHGNNIYARVTLCCEGKRKDYFIHRLVYETFIGVNPEKVWHINRDSLDNRIENLEEISQAELNRRTKTRGNN